MRDFYLEKTFSANDCSGCCALNTIYRVSEWDKKGKDRFRGDTWMALNYHKAQKWHLSVCFSRGPEYRLWRQKEEKTCRDLGTKDERLGTLQGCGCRGRNLEGRKQKYDVLGNFQSLNGDRFEFSIYFTSLLETP